jgi:hypothetical protein
VPTPSGVFVGVQLASNASVRNMGELLTEQREHLAHIWQVQVNLEHAQGKASDAVKEAASGVKISDLSKIVYKIELLGGTELAWNEYLFIEEQILGLILGDKYPNIFHALLAVIELLGEAITLKTSGQDLDKLKGFTPSIDRWLSAEPGFFEQRVFRLLCFKNLVWPHVRKSHAENWASQGANPMSDPAVMKVAANSVIFGNMDLPSLGTVSIDKASKHKVAALSPEIDGFWRRYFYLKIFSKSYCGPALSGLSVMAGFNSLVAGFLSVMIFAKAHSVARKDKEIKIFDLYEGCWVLDREMLVLAQLPKAKASFYDVGLSSPRLFSKLLGQMSRSVGT